MGDQKPSILNDEWISEDYVTGFTMRLLALVTLNCMRKDLKSAYEKIAYLRLVVKLQTMTSPIWDGHKNGFAVDILHIPDRKTEFQQFPNHHFEHHRRHRLLIIICQRSEKICLLLIY